jgi:hypothetical protein
MARLFTLRMPRFLALLFTLWIAGCASPFNPLYRPENFTPSAPPGPDMGVYVRVVTATMSGGFVKATPSEVTRVQTGVREALVQGLQAKGYRPKVILENLLPEGPTGFLQVAMFSDDDYAKMKASLPSTLPRLGASSVLVYNTMLVHDTNFRRPVLDGIYASFQVIDASGNLVIVSPVRFVDETSRTEPYRGTLGDKEWFEKVQDAVLRKIPDYASTKK